MTHLFADLMRYHDPLWAAAVPFLSLPTILLALTLVRGARLARPAERALRVLGSVACLAGLGLFAFCATTLSSFPQIDVSPDVRTLVAFLAVAAATGTGTVLIVAFARRSARNALLAGSLISSGFSCAMFLGLSGLAAPFALSYDLTAVLVVMAVGSFLASYAIWEGVRPGRYLSRLYAALLGTGAVTVLSFGSVSSVLSFGDWMNAVAMPDDITSAPIMVIGAAEAGIVLVLSLVGSLIDNRTAARDQQEADRLHQLADATFEAIVIHRDGLVLDGNANLTRLLDTTLFGLQGRELSRFLPTAGEARHHGGPSLPVRAEGEIVTPSGRRVPVEMLSRPIAYRKAPATITALRDISERRASEARIRFLAHHDALTELPNRALLTETLEQSVWRARASGEALAVLCLDLDGFKLVNDTHGHAAGDELLRQVAARLRACLEGGEFAARIGGDEFVVLQAGAAQPEAASDLARRIVASLLVPFQLEAGPARVGTSIGIAIHPEDAQAPDDLLRKADLALYRAKRNGRGWYCRFDESMGEAAENEQEFERELRQAADRGEFSLAYQPIFDRDRRIVCFEALLRWTHPTMGPVPPVRFIPVAERRGLIVGIGDWVLREACRTAAAWPASCRVAVNLSPLQMERGDLPDRVGAILSETGLAPGRLELELTEGVLLEEGSGILAVMERLRESGARLVLDDFGAGYSSLSHLCRYPFDKLKIDRTFVQRLGADPASQAIVRAAIALGRDLGIVVTAEGVETPDQLERLDRDLCPEIQGFLLGRPVTEDKAHALLLDRAADDAVALLRAGVPPADGARGVREGR